MDESPPSASFASSRAQDEALAPNRSPRAPATSASGGCLMAIVKMVVAPLVGLAIMTVFALVFAGTLFPAGDEKPAEKFHSLNAQATDKIAIVTVDGTILEGEGFVKKQIDAVRADEHVRAVVLRIDSPGGSVTASDYMLHHLVKLREERNLPIVVSMGGMAASGGYYVAMAVGKEKDSIFAEPTTWTGSIGVVIPHFNVEGLLKRYEIEDDSIKSHPLKQMGTPTKKLTEQERKIFQALVDDCFDTFKQTILSGRPNLGADKLDELATGQVFTAKQAIANGLVDKQGFIEDAIDRAIELAGLSREHVKAVRYRRPPAIFDLFAGAQAKAAPAIDAKGLADLLTPRAYYLCSWLPTLAQSGE